MKLKKIFKIAAAATKEFKFDVPKGVTIKKVILMSDTYVTNGELITFKGAVDDFGNDYNISVGDVFLFFTKICILNGAAGVEEQGALGMTTFDFEGQEVKSVDGNIYFGISNQTANGDEFIIILLTDESTRDD